MTRSSLGAEMDRAYRVFANAAATAYMVPSPASTANLARAYAVYKALAQAWTQA